MTIRFFKSIVNNLVPDAEIDDVVRLTGGVSAIVHRIELKLVGGETTSLVVRVHGASHSGHSAELEYQLLKALRRIGILVPVPVHVDSSGRLLANPYVVLEYVDGTSEVRIERQVASINIMAKVLVEIHSASTTTLRSLPTRINPLPEVFDYLPQARDWDHLRRYLHSLWETANTETQLLLHGDFWPENLLWKNGHLVAVLDWEDAAYGDPLSDVAGCRLELRYKFGKQAMHQFTQAYARQRPVDPVRLALWQVYVASAAQHFMGQWGRAKTLEAHMRNEALSSIREVAAVLMG